MKSLGAIKQFCHTLDGLQGLLVLFPRGVDEFLFSHGYPRYRQEVESLRAGLEELGLFETVRDAISESETMGLAGRYEEASAIVFEANRRLSEASGANDDLRRMYRAAND